MKVDILHLFIVKYPPIYKIGNFIGDILLRYNNEIKKKSKIMKSVIKAIKVDSSPKFSKVSLFQILKINLNYLGSAT